MAFAKRPRDYSQKLPKKMYRTAIKSIISEHIRKNTLTVVDELTVDSPKTKDFISKYKDLLDRKVYMISIEVSEDFYLASRNLHKVFLSDVIGIDPLSLYQADQILVTKDAMLKIQEWLS